MLTDDYLYRADTVFLPTQLLSCDPHPVRKPDGGIRVYFTLGRDASGPNCGGLSYVDFEADGRVSKETYATTYTYRGQSIQVSRTRKKAAITPVVPLCNYAGYGKGQPNVILSPSGAPWIAYRDDGDVVKVNQLVNEQLGQTVPFINAANQIVTEGVAQPEFFRLPTKPSLYRVITGPIIPVPNAPATGTRSWLRVYDMSSGTAQFPNGFIKRTDAGDPTVSLTEGPAFPQFFDGPGVEKNDQNVANISNGRIVYWNGAQTLANGTPQADAVRLQRFSVPAP